MAGGGRGKEKRVRNNRRKTSVRGRGSSAARGEDHTRAARYSRRYSNPGRAHTGTGFFLKDCSPWKGPTLEQGESVWRKEQQRDIVIY